MKILHVNACVRENSRTKILADYLLNKIQGTVEEVKLNEISMFPLNSDLLNQRDELISQEKFFAPIFTLAKQFSEADIIVISAPFWDLSFPALLKVYIEQINVSGIVFKYSQKGIPISLCQAQKMFFVTTSGGAIKDDNFGFGYIKNLAKTFWGVNDITCINAQMLDVIGSDIEKILLNTKKEIDKLFEDVEKF